MKDEKIQPQGIYLFETWSSIQPGGRVWSLLSPSSPEAEFRLQSSHRAQVFNELWINKRNFTFHGVSKYINCIQWPKTYMTSSTSGQASFPSFQPSGITVSVSLLYWSGGEIDSIFSRFRLVTYFCLQSSRLAVGNILVSFHWAGNRLFQLMWKMTHSKKLKCWVIDG